MGVSTAASRDVEAIARIAAVPRILEAVARLTGMGFVAIARVTEFDWTACAVRDEIDFGLAPGDGLELETTICDEIRQHQQPVVFGHASRHPQYAGHHTPRRYGLESYISVPILRASGEFFGTLCAIDPRPAELDDPNILRTLELFAELVGAQLESEDRLKVSESALSTALDAARSREEFIAVVSRDFRNPIQAVLMDTYLIREWPGLDPDVRARVVAIEDNIWRMSALLEGIGDFPHRRLADGVPATLRTAGDVASELGHALSRVAALHPQRALAASIEIRHAVECDLARIGQLLAILATSVSGFSRPGQTVEIEARTSDTALVLSVQGPDLDLSPERLTRLFEPPPHGGDGPAAPVPGGDLFIAAEIARAHGGRLEAKAGGPGIGLQFSMRLRMTDAGEHPAPAISA